MGQLIALVVGLLAAGAVTGMLAGVFGVGGGAIIVPVLDELFRLQGVPEDVRHAARGRHVPGGHHPNVDPLVQGASAKRRG